MLKGKFSFSHFWLAFSSFTTIIIPTMLLLGLKFASAFPIARPNCPNKCGNVSIPYPFGIGDDCHYKHPIDGDYYNITCNETKVPVVPTYGKNVEIVNITMDGNFVVKNYLSYDCYDENGQGTRNFTSWISVSRFALSTTQNFAGGIGCDTLAFFSGTRMKSTNTFLSGCATACSNQSDVSEKCSGIGCCLASIPDGITNITIEASSATNQSEVQKFNPCSVAFVVAKNHVGENEMPFSIEDVMKSDYSYFYNIRLPMVYNWSIGTKDCKAAKVANEYICGENSICVDLSEEERGYRCQCNPGFEGNPYLHDCQDIDECNTLDLNSCEEREYCINTPGSFSCKCPKGSSGNGTKASRCILNSNRKKLLLSIKIIVGISGGIIISLIVAFWFHWQHGNKKLQKLRDTFFHQNGGHILVQKLARRDVALGNSVRMFHAEELNKATDNFCEQSIIGRGGFGMVYKGILPSNQIVAIKRSLKVDSSQVEQFINEILALSQINNVNVVKLLGCCLETEVPLLVYEFVSNGTLYEHLHDEENTHIISWDVRLRVASEVAEVLAYLHTTISIPIIHRDIKSANILLDDKFTAKVADFGASKLAPVDQEQLATMVQGTCGYLDPEYMQTGELTEKSDVYSFGVVLVELLTREKAISYLKPEKDRSLAIYFLRKIKENLLFEIIDKKILKDEIIDQLKEVANLAKSCLKLKGDDRPTMKEVARELDRIKAMYNHQWSNNSVQFQEESEFLLHETRELNIGIESEGMNDSLSSQSRVVQLVPLNDGR